MPSSSDNIKFTSYSDANDVMDRHFKPLRSIYQVNLETSVQILYYKCHKVNFSRGGSYIDSPDWVKKKNQQQI